MIWEAVAQPFVEFAFMRRALVGSLAVALASAPVGVFLTLRRMSMTGDAIAHGMLPGVAAAYLLAGLSLYAMTLGGLVSGLAVAVLAGLTARVTVQREDASLACFHLLALALGVVIVSLGGSQVDLVHVLFGSVLALGDDAVLTLAGAASVTLLALTLIYRPLVLECVDSAFLKAVGGRTGAWVHHVFMSLVVLDLVAGFHALGSLMAVGIMILPAAAARFWAQDIDRMITVAVAVALLSVPAGLLASFHADIPCGPAIVLAAGAIYLLSMALGPYGSLRPLTIPAWHYRA